MNTKVPVLNEDELHSFLAKLEEGDLPPKACQILNDALKRGEITTQEIVALLPDRVIKDKEILSSLIVQIGEYLRSSRIHIVSSGHEAEHKEKFPPVPTKKLILSQPSENISSAKKHIPRKVSEGKMSIPCPKIDEPLSDVWALEAANQNLFDTLDRYYREIGRFRFLTHEEEVELSRRILEEQDLEARNTLVLHNLRLVRWVARRFVWSELPFGDLLQEGNIGLITAAEKYDYRKGFRFTTYAAWWVRQSIIRGIQDCENVIRLPVHIQELRQKVLAAAAEIAGGAHDFPSEEAIAEKLELPVAVIKKVLRIMRLNTVSLDKEIAGSDGDGSDMLLGDVIVDPNAVDPLTILEARQELELVSEAVSSVIEEVIKDSSNRYSERNARIFEALYGLDGTREEKTLEEVGRRFGLTHERVRQIIEKIWERLSELGIDLTNEKLRQHLWRIGELEKLAHMGVNFNE